MMEKKLFYLLLFTAATGICTGAFFEVSVTGAGKDQLIQLLSAFFSTGGDGLSFLASFWTLFSRSFFFLLLCFVSPLLFLLLPVNVILLFLRSLFLGFSAAMVLETFGTSGITYLLLTLAPAGLLQLLLFSCLFTLSLQEWHARRKRRSKNRSALSFLTGQYLQIYLAGLAILLFTCLLQAYLLQAVTGP